MQNLIPSLIKARSQFPTIKKDAQGQLGNRRYAYATLDTIIDSTYPALARNGLCIVNTMEFDGTHRVLICTLYHESGESIQSRYVLPPCVDSRELGSAITYGRRYLLCSVLNLSLEQDLDGGTHQSESTARQKPSSPPPRKNNNSPQQFTSNTPPQPQQTEYTKQDWIKAIDAILKHKKIDTTAARNILLDLFKVRSRSLLNLQQLAQFFEYLKTCNPVGNNAQSGGLAIAN